MLKNIKKILLIIIILAIISNINFVFAWEETNSCVIQNTPDYIKEYIQNNRKAISNINRISREVHKNKKEGTIDHFINRDRLNRIYWALNSLFNWNSYELWFIYTIQWNIWEIPDQIKRDIRILKLEYKNIRLANPSAISIKITKQDICKWIDSEICNFHKNYQATSLEAITKLKNSTKILTEILLNQATDIDLRPNLDWLLFISTDVLNQIKNDYSKKNLQICSIWENNQWQKWFFWQIIEAFKNIWFTSNKSRDSWNDWVESVNLIRWSSDTHKYRKLERELLARELQSKWIGWDKANTILSNLEAYNKSLPWEIRIMQAEEWFLNSLKNQINAFDEMIKIKFPEWEQNAQSVRNISRQVNLLKRNQSIKIDINTQYQRLKYLALQKDHSSEILVNRIIKMNLRLSEAINRLNRTCKISVKVCNSQKKWQWNCGECF